MGTTVNIVTYFMSSSRNRLDIMGISRKLVNSYSTIFVMDIVSSYWKII